MATATDAYQRDMVFSMPREQLLLKLYEALLQRIETARTALSNGDRALAGNAISRSLDIVTALRDALDATTGAPCVPKLDQLYRTVSAWLIEANVTQSPRLLDSTHKVLGTLKDGWDGAVASVR